jgi:hypothetical protein
MVTFLHIKSVAEDFEWDVLSPGRLFDLSAVFEGDNQNGKRKNLRIDSLAVFHFLSFISVL